MVKLKLQYLATWCEELTHWKRSWCWERLKAKAEGGDRGWDGWMASPTQWTWVWANSGRQWRTGKPGMLQFTGSQSVGHHLATEVMSFREEHHRGELPFSTQHIKRTGSQLNLPLKRLTVTTWIRKCLPDFSVAKFLSCFPASILYPLEEHH